MTNTNTNPLYIILNRGLIASGKSTYSRELLHNRNGTVKRINRDDLRNMVDDGVWSKENERLIIKSRDALIKLYLENGYSVIVDDTNLTSSIFTDIVKLTSSVSNKIRKSITVTEKWHEISLNEAIERDEKRTGRHHIGKDPIINMWNRFHLNSNKEIRIERSEVVTSTQNINSYEYQNNTLPRCIIVDIDGTIALKGDRSPFDMTKVDQDTVNYPVVSLLKYLDPNDRPNVILVSGRSDDGREKTEKWLKENNIEYDMLLMRKFGDNRKDSIIKKELYVHYIKDNYFVEFILDDRNQTVEMWRNGLGLPCFQVAYGDF